MNDAAYVNLYFFSAAFLNLGSMGALGGVSVSISGGVRDLGWWGRNLIFIVTNVLHKLSFTFNNECRQQSNLWPLDQCFSSAGPRPCTGPWHQLHLAARGSPEICHSSFLSNFLE